MKILVAGGAGFIGSHMVRHLLLSSDHEVIVYDNFCSGTQEHLQPQLEHPRLRICAGDLKDRAALTQALSGIQRVYHFASNPDIAKAMRCPDVDFWEGTYLTQNLLEAMRATGTKELIYASGSGVYGDVGNLAVQEDYGPLLPISPYGASKLACEAMIHAYTHLFGFQARVFRFANVIGPRQTHGVAYDFIRRLRATPQRLEILGDGSQSKSYIHVEDIIAGLQHFTSRDTAPYTYYHLATKDYLTVREIATLVIEAMGLSRVELVYAGGTRGWSGDVPVVRFNLAKAHAAGWRARRTSREAMQAAIQAMLLETQK